jgi:electron transport complex protein RnfC
MEKAFADIDGNVEIVVLPVLYPQGSEKHQIYATVGRVVPEGGLPIAVGCVVENVGTAAAIAEAVMDGMPLIRRVTTVSGDAVATPKNILAPVGTRYADLIAFAGGEKVPPAKIISGGTMMGFNVSSTEIGTTKTTSGLLLLSHARVFQYSSQPCINCGRCVEACPEQLVPSKLADYAEHKQFDLFEKWYGLECVECGSCSFGCPARRHLAQSIKSA